MKKASSALQLLTIVWESGKKDTRERINHAMREALSLSIGSGLTFKASDFAHFSDKFRWGYWVTESPEWIYREAIINGNESCWKAFEDFCGREPFFANGVCCDYASSPYLHASSVERKRERLAVGLYFQADGRRWYVTGFDDQSGTVRVAAYPGTHNRGKPNKLRKLTHDDLKAICPAPN